MNHQPVKTTRFVLLSQSWPEDEGAEIAGSSVQVYYIARELAARGFPVLVLLSSPSKDYQGSKGNPCVVPVSGDSKLRKQLAAGWKGRMMEELERFKPDVIYQRGKLPESVVAADYAVKHGAKYVWSSNSDQSGERWKYLKKRWGKKRDILKLVPRIMEATVADTLIEGAFRRADLVLAQNEHQRNRLRENFGLEATIIGSGHPVPEFTARDSDTLKVLWLANLSPVKRPWLFAELARSLRDLNVEFVMAGRAPDPEILERVMKVAEGVANFRYVGPVSMQEGNRLFAESDLFTLTSEYEGLPNTLIQACIHGLPTISLGNDPTDLIEANRIGEVSATFDEFVEAVRTWVGDSARLKEGGVTAYRFAKENFDIMRTVDVLLGTIEGRFPGILS